MGLVALLFLWPFLILAFGLVFIAFNDLSFGAFWTIFFVLFLILVLQVRDRSRTKGQQTNLQQMEHLRQLVFIFSIGLLIPIFVRYLFDTFNHNLPVVISGLLIGFGLTVWGMFLKSNKILLYSNILGGALTIIYVYFQLWELGGLARVVAAAVGLVIAVVVSTIKLKDKLT